MLYKGKASSLSGVAVARAAYPGDPTLEFLLTNTELRPTGSEGPTWKKGFPEEWEPLSKGSGISGSPAHPGLIRPKSLEKQGRNEKELTVEGKGFGKD